MSGGAWRKVSKRRKKRAGHPRHPSGTPSFSHLPCPGLSPVASSPAGDPVEGAHPWPRRAGGRPPAGSRARSCSGAGPPPPCSSARSRRCPLSSWRSAPLGRHGGGRHRGAVALSARPAPGPGGPRPAAPVPAPSPCRQKRPSQPSAQSQRNPPRPSMHLPRPQQGSSHGLPEGRCSHWSPSATRGEEGVTRAAGPLPVPPATQRPPRGRGMVARGLERTHRYTWTRRPPAERRGGIRGRQPTCVNGEPLGPLPGLAQVQQGSI